MRNVTKKLIAKYNMYATKSDWVKYQFGKVHIIFAIITALAFGFVFGMGYNFTGNNADGSCYCR